MCAERVNWKNKARNTWEARCAEVAQAIYERADLSRLGEAEDHSGWETEEFMKDSRTRMLSIERPVFFKSEEDGEPTVKGRVATLFAFPGADDACATLPTEAWASLGGQGIPLHMDVVPFEANEMALWKTYYALVQHEDSTLEALNLGVVLEEAKSGLEKDVGADMASDLLYCYQMLSDMTADALKKYGLVDVYEALDAATQQTNAPSGPGGM